MKDLDLSERPKTTKEYEEEVDVVKQST